MREAFLNTEELVKLLASPVLLKSFNALLNDHGDFASTEPHFTLSNVTNDYMFEKRSIMYFLAWTPDTIVFTLRMFLTPKTGYITMVHTHDGYKRRGICSGAFKKIFKHLPEITKWKLDVESGNTAAIACYEKLGFKAAGRQLFSDAITMTLLRKNS
jgi:ribosomal protein S18 acetylase RimI-like enzyme